MFEDLDLVLCVTKVVVERAIAENSEIIKTGHEGKRCNARPKIANSK